MGALKSTGGTGRALESKVASSGASELRGWFGGSLDWLGRPEAILLLETGFRSQLLALVLFLETIFDHLGWTRGWHPMHMYKKPGDPAGDAPGYLMSACPHAKIGSGVRPWLPRWLEV